MELTTISKRDIHSKRSKDFVTPFAIQRDASDFPIIVYSHLAWDWVWQRPQQFHSRLSKTHPILFVESPTAADEVAESCVTLREVSDYPNIVVLQVQIPAARLRSGGAWVESERRRLIQSVLEGPLGREFENSVQWFYDPMAVRALAGHLD